MKYSSASGSSGKRQIAQIFVVLLLKIFQFFFILDQSVFFLIQKLLLGLKICSYMLFNKYMSTRVTRYLIFHKNMCFPFYFTPILVFEMMNLFYQYISVTNKSNFISKFICKSTTVNSILNLSERFFLSLLCVHLCSINDSLGTLTNCSAVYWLYPSSRFSFLKF